MSGEITRFELEEAITACWNTSDDIDLIARAVDDKDDELLNALIGVKNLNDRRLQRVMDIFETLVAERKI